MALRGPWAKLTENPCFTVTAVLSTDFTRQPVFFGTRKVVNRKKYHHFTYEKDVMFFNQM